MLAVSLVTSTPLREDWMQFYRQRSAEMYVLVYVILTGMMLQGLTSCQNSSHTFTQNTHTHSHNILTHIHTTYTQHTHIHTHTDNWMEVRRSSNVILCF